MPEFLKDFNLVYIIGIISGVVAGIWAFYKFVYEKKLERFKDASTKIFSDNEDEVLAAVANLGVFKRDFLFERNTIDVLLTRLYKELNYNITNAITTALIQFSNRRELLYIANEIGGINRNFHFQTKPYSDMLSDVTVLYDRINKIKNNNTADITDLKTIETEKEIIDKRHARCSEEFMRLNQKVSYELLWHKQITADTFARIIRRAAALKFPLSITFLNYIKQILFNWDATFYGRRIPLNIYQNPFAYVHMVQFKTNYCSIRRSGFERATIADIEFNNIDDIYDCSFDRAYITDCIFKKGRVTKGEIRSSLFTSITFINVKFIKISFTDIFFTASKFTNCAFVNCTGLSSENFYATTLEGTTMILPEGITKESIDNTKALAVIKKVLDFNLRASDIEHIINKCAESIKTVDEIYEIYAGDLSNDRKQKIITTASANFKLNTSYDNIIQLKCDDTVKLQLIYYLFHNKPLDELMVEIYDTALTDDQLKVILPYLKSTTTLPEFEDSIINNKVLTAAEKTNFLTQLQNIFASPPPATPPSQPVTP